jgi:6-phosphogluconolactonase
MTAPDIRVFADLNALSAAAAEALVATLNHAVRANGRGSLVLSGGSTPRALYQLLGSAWRDQIPWGAVHLFWGDERYVPHADPDSNYRLTKETLLDHVPCPPANIHPMPTDFADPDAAARAYDATLHRYFEDGPPRFDLVLLGLGEEGHTASLFPRSPALAERTRWTAAVTAPVNPPRRLTLTMPALVHAAAIYFLVAGSSKAHPLSQVLKTTADPILYPAAGIRSDEGTVIWWVDQDAAGEYRGAGRTSKTVLTRRAEP